MITGDGFVIYSPTLEKYFNDGEFYEWGNVSKSFTHSDVNQASFYKMQSTVLDKVLHLSHCNPGIVFIIRSAVNGISLLNEDDVSIGTTIDDVHGEQIIELQKAVDIVMALNDEETEALSLAAWATHKRQKRRLRKLKEYVTQHAA